MSNTTMDQLEKAHKAGVVLGLAGFGTEQRLDIDVMLTEQPDTFNLYLIALMELQGMKDLPWPTPDGYSFQDGSQADLKMSWFQLTGIHGQPPHFGTWHRPYLAMMEQTLFRQVANVAKRFSESNIPDEQKKKYLAAAEQFRLPYWDYFRPRAYSKTTFPGVTNPRKGTTTAPYDWGAPQIFTLREVMVRRLPDNKLVPMKNPFFQFEFSDEQLSKIRLDQDLRRRIKPQFDNILQTIRHGGSDADAMERMNVQLNQDREGRIRLCLALMEDEVYRNFRTFSTNAVLSKPGERPIAMLEEASGSIEDFHGAYHVTIGNPDGHMGSIATAAFDPIFWMHHCQIDRLFAIWQAANGDEHWFNELPKDKQGLATIDLTPFRKSVSENNEKKYWTSDLSRRTTDFGYTYPDTARGQTGDNIRKEFREKYEWSRRTTAKLVFGTPPDDMKPIEVGEAQVFQYPPGNSSGDLLRGPGLPIHEMQQQTVMAEMPSNPQYADDWYIDIVVERMLANGTYTIYYIIGEVQGQTGQEWSSLPGFAGLSHILAAPANVCDNCASQEEQGQLVTSTTAITSLLLDYVQIGKLSSMGEDDVKKFLIENLKWRVQTIAGEVLNPRDMDRDHTFNLSISRKRTPVPRSAGDVQYKTYPEVIEAIINNSS
ncbi:tyrosinase precursor (monophenol monooxygenase) [Fusarium subglutinans]|uniref:tyrosinase n=1 Tax=Gibberella subglutinans TaxID=42677 RepID=A0A8H5P6M4_GIBSU|nr:tyrosinase precursor (monophenol monooxygenase) [Fusarium subglutinans]KAF5591026.1 tyrosinase precursor (monophenol monooxygenase) [Fusarium subglutinans]